MSVSKAIESRNRLSRWWVSSTGRSFAKGFANSMEKSTWKNDEPRSGDWLDNLAEVEAEKLEHCPPFLVTEDMVTLVEAASKDMPFQRIYPEDLPSPAGFAYLEKPVVMMDKRTKPVDIKAFSWAPVPITVKSKQDGATTVQTWGTFVTLYSDRDMSIEEEWGELMPPKDVIKLRHDYPDLMLLHVMPLMYGEYDKEEDREPGSVLPFILAFWAISQQRIAWWSEGKLPRGTRRALEREGEVPTVTVITLRRLSDKHHEKGEEGYVEWSHRWLVSGHWRRIWDQKRDMHRLTWVTEHVKGPEDKPLVVKDKVYRLSR